MMAAEFFSNYTKRPGENRTDWWLEFAEAYAEQRLENERDAAEKRLAEVPSQVKEFVRDSDRVFGLIERAAELLRLFASDEKYQPPTWPKGQFTEKVNQWLRDAGI